MQSGLELLQGLQAANRHLLTNQVSEGRSLHVALVSSLCAKKKVLTWC